jgi:hypothetical protein
MVGWLMILRDLGVAAISTVEIPGQVGNWWKSTSRPLCLLANEVKRVISPSPTP